MMLVNWSEEAASNASVVRNVRFQFAFVSHCLPDGVKLVLCPRPLFAFSSPSLNHS